MAQDIKNVFYRSADTILADAVGVVSLIVMLFGALALPAFL